jgi:putative sigma-54 modulation protein
MRLLVSCQKKLSSKALVEHTQRRLGFAVDRFASAVRQIRVRIADVNGPRGGPDKNVRIVATLFGKGAITVEGSGTDAYLTCDLVVDKLKNALGRALERKRPERGLRGL